MIFIIKLRLDEEMRILYLDGVTSSGVYTIIPDGGNRIQVLCDMTTNGKAWIVFQRRLNGSVDFYRDWSSYKNGFGDLKGLEMTIFIA